jgi:membrane protease YdiL (CAAX protease family)
MDDRSLRGSVPEIRRAIRQVVERAGPASLCLWTFLLGTLLLYMQVAGWPVGTRIPAAIAFAWLLVPFVALADEGAVTRLRALPGSPRRQAGWGVLGLLLPGLLGLGLAPSHAALSVAVAPVYLLLPALLLARPGLPDRLTALDTVALVLLWLPPDLGLLPSPLAKLLALDMTLYLFLVVRRLEGVGYRYRLSPRDLRAALTNTLAFGALAIPLGLATGFLAFAPGRSGWTDLFFRMVAVYFAVALPEEVLFRGILLTLLRRTFRRRGPTAALLLSSGLFGLAHWKERDWRYMVLAALAGIFYGRTFLETGSVIASALTHGLVDFLWGLLFRTQWAGRA